MSPDVIFLITVTWAVIGLLFAYNMAISPQAAVMLMLLWPIFLLLILIAYPLNVYLNRREGR